jgi:hypothetical protein
MPMLVAGLLLLWLSSFLLRGFVKANPTVMARLMRRIGGSFALGFGLLMLFRGEFNLAVAAGACGMWLLGSTSRPLAGLRVRGFARRWRPPVHIRTLSLDVALDHSTQSLSGVFRAGPYAGRSLDTLGWADSLGAYRWCLGADPDGARMLEAYFDGRFAGWRDAADVAGDAGGTQTGRGMGGAASMADHEAYNILGLAQSASREEIARAHRRLMKQYHPDHGGSTEMAARVNQAKDVLMRRHPRTRVTQ